MKSLVKFVLLGIYSIAMANLEAAVVVYLRELYYPEGFAFPLKLISDNILLIELTREFSTIIMLFCIAYLCDKSYLERFFYFIYAFGIWDIFYYVWLKIFVNWPSSFLTDDILFLIPVPWVAPVYAPVGVSLCMIIFSIVTFYLQQKGFSLKINKLSIIVSIIGIALILFSFMWDFQTRINSIAPIKYEWEILLAGLLLIIFGFVYFIVKIMKG